MPFEPRLVAQDDDGPGRLVAPARLEVDEFATPDLEVLAAQLGDDAAYLAKLYPPRATPTRLLERRRGWSALINGRWRVAAAVLCFAGTAAALSVWGVATQAESQPIAWASGSIVRRFELIAARDLDPVLLNEQSVEVSTSGALRVAAAPAMGDSSSKHVLTESSFTGLEPGDLLQDLSVSEQEAVFDLLESEPIELARVSL